MNDRETHELIMSRMIVREDNALTIAETLYQLSTVGEDVPYAYGLVNPHSHRGGYADVAFELLAGSTSGEVKAALRGVIGQSYEGYKGGDYVMTEDSHVYVARQECEGSSMSYWMLELLWRGPPVTFPDATE